MTPVRTVLKDDPYSRTDEDVLEFRLTYQGRLLAASKNDPRTEHKHEIRRHFHKQLGRLWKLAPHFSGTGSSFIITDSRYKPPATTIAELSQQFARIGYNFVPLVTRDLSLNCSIDILFLRPDPPGSVLKSGDIDNRLKTLFDALRLPNQKSELGRYGVPAEDETPFFCLLEDDSLITKISVETDILLEPISDDTNDARIVLSVRVTPLALTMYNMHLG